MKDDLVGVKIMIVTGGLIIVLWVCVAVAGLIDKDKLVKSCNTSCGIIKSEVMHDMCFCMTEKGWQQKQ